MCMMAQNPGTNTAPWNFHTLQVVSLNFHTTYISLFGFEYFVYYMRLVSILDITG